MPTAAASKPVKVTLRSYNVGFGDAFLLTFHYKDRDRHILIDFGSTRAPEAFASRSDFMKDIAGKISEHCGGKLDAVVATHRHKDHISGFTTSKKADGSGDIIRSLKPDLVIQPWTEDPDAEPDAEVPVNDPGKAVSNFVGGLRNLHVVAGAVKDVSGREWFGKELMGQLEFLGDDNLANRSAIDNLQRMSKKRKFVYFGSKSGLEKILPGVKVHVLGPPTLKQSQKIRAQKSSDKDEFWMFASFWSVQAFAARHATGENGPLFPKAATNPTGAAPVETRWVMHKLRALHGEQLLGIVRELDKAMNNTSVILLFEVGGKRLLFPGDAQIENWSYALQTLRDKGQFEMLEKVDLYKVGHHGSRNATPKSLWEAFKKKGGKTKPGRLRTVMSTKSGVHGKTESTRVPRKTLVDELQAHSDLQDTRTLKVSDDAEGFFHLMELEL